MKKSRVTILVVGALVAGLTLGSIGIASAVNRTPRSASRASYSGTMMGTTSPVATLSTLTGLSVQQIMALRAQGKSLSAIAVDNGIDPATVVDQTVAARQSYLDTLVAAGTITAAQEQAALDKIRAAVQAMMDTVPGTHTAPSTTTTPSVPATGAAGSGYKCPNARAGMNAPATVGPRSGSGNTGRGSCPNYVAPTAPTSGTDQSGTGGTRGRGNGSCGW